MSAAAGEPQVPAALNRSSGHACPECGSPVGADSERCPSCAFTGSHTMDMFPDPAPPLLAVLDAAGLWKSDDERIIDAARERLRRRFPQFRFCVCTVSLPESTSLATFGFWMLNVCPFDVGETRQDRSWTILLLINAPDGRAAVIPGYSAERWVRDEDWKKILSTSARLWKAGKSARAIVRFFESTAGFLDASWKRRDHPQTDFSKP